MKQSELVIVQTSDIHGNIFPINYGNNEETNSGLAKLATVIRQEIKEADCKLLIDSGDVIEGTPLTYHYAKHLCKKKNPIISVLNYLQYDAAIIGNHEFNFGMDFLNKAVRESSFPWLSANIIDAKTYQPVFGKPYMIKEFTCGLRVAVLGVTTHFIPNWENPLNIEGMHFQDAFESTKKWVERLHMTEKFDLLVVSYHGGVERNLKTGEPTEQQTGENQAYRMCEEIPGIDVLLTGHQHRQLSAILNGVIVGQPGHNGQAIVKINISFEYTNGKWSVTNKSSEVIGIEEGTDEDATILKLVQEYEDETQKWLDHPLGEISGDMLVHSPLEVRIRDHPLIEFINKVQMDAAAVAISSTALFHNGSPGFPQKVTMRDIVSNYIYPNTLKVIRISGQDIKDALEKSAEYFILDDNGKIKVNPAFEKPKPQHYNYDMWEGIEYILDLSKAAGSRVIKLDYQGSPIKLRNHFDVVMNNYRAGGGGNFDMFKGKPVIKEIQKDMTELLAEYIQKYRIIEASCNENWRIIF